MKDRVRAQKFESAATGGTDGDIYPVDLDPHQDYSDSRGCTFQDSTSNDETVGHEREEQSGLLHAFDQAIGNVPTWSLGQAGVPRSCYVEADSFPFPLHEVTYTDNTKQKRLRDVTYSEQSPSPATVTTRIYAGDGTTVACTYVDQFTYNGPFVLTQTRTRQ